MDWRVVRHALIGGAIVGAVFHVALCCSLHEMRGSRDETERARFMLECAYDWQLAPETCERMLEGERPPVPPPE